MNARAGGALLFAMMLLLASRRTAGGSVGPIYVLVVAKDDSIDIDALTPEVRRVLPRVGSIFVELAGRACIVTSTVEGVHTTGSKHFVGDAFDCRTKDLAPALIERIAGRVRAELGARWTVLIEHDPEHLHVQFNR